MGAPVSGTCRISRQIGHCSCSWTAGLFKLLRGISGGWCVGAIVLMVSMIVLLDVLAS